MDEYVFTREPEDYLLDQEVDLIEDAENDLLNDEGTDIDNIGDITDEDVDANEYDPLDDIDEYQDTYNDQNYIASISYSSNRYIRPVSPSFIIEGVPPT